MIGKNITICSVSYNSNSYLDLNWKLTKRLNIKDDYSWIVVENSNSRSRNRMGKSDKRFKLIEGLAPNVHKLHGSYNHAYGLNKCLEHIETRFVLLIDPDFFIIRRNWIDSVLNHMIKNKLAFIGTPYHPARFIKYRYFPSVICMFIDLKKVNKDDLDFTPEILLQESKKDLVGNLEKVEKLSFLSLKKIIKKNSIIYNILLKILNFLDYTFKRGRIIGSSKDTGYKVYLKFARKRNINYECFIPVFKKSYLKKDFVQRIAESILPDDWCYVPKREDYFSEKGFKEKGLFDVDKLGWEEYLWKGKPFGFHIRGVFQGVKTVDLLKLENILKSFKK